MTFLHTFLPILGIGCALFITGILWLIYRFFAFVLEGLLR
jgi:hypothetical protein